MLPSLVFSVSIRSLPVGVCEFRGLDQMLVPFGFLVGTSGMGARGAGDVPFSRDLRQDRNDFNASRLPAILTGHRGSLPLRKVMVIVSEEAKSSSQSLS